jgi:alcohol-forming fatty acyl-CoA reductase
MVSPEPARQEVLLTGATGFLGKVVLAELLERMPQARIWTLLRPSAHHTARERHVRQIRMSPAFRDLPRTAWERVKPLRGDLAHEDLGISPAMTRLLRERLTHVVHCAASVDFEQPLKAAARSNIAGSLHTLALARSCTVPPVMVSVSTAYVGPHPPVGPIREALVPLPVDPAETYAAIRAGELHQGELLTATGHPNTYTLTKCLAEHLLVAERGDVPLRIVRPSIISASRAKPVPGWIDSYAAFAGFVVLIGAGRLRALRAEPDNPLDIVPCDAVATRIVDCALEPADPGHHSIHFAVVGLDRAPTVLECCDRIVDHFREHPIDRRPGMSYVGSDPVRFELEHLQHHVAPRTLATTWLKMLGRERTRIGVKRLFQRVAYLNEAFPYFTHNAFDFRPAEPLDLGDHDPGGYITGVCRGVTKYLMGR